MWVFLWLFSSLPSCPAVSLFPSFRRLRTKEVTLRPWYDRHSIRKHRINGEGYAVLQYLQRSTHRVPLHEKTGQGTVRH
ncbi:hypothetical protein F4680DRAFT_36552 [Xylaria scruposa]|nr:hypothetical protein F4680DRAFT_36552 [Xylaria scruposa]